MKQFLTVGTNKIVSEFFTKPLPHPFLDNNITKPSGGLWLTEHKSINANEWLFYLTTRNHLFMQKFSPEACIVYTKDDAKIACPESFEDLRELHEMYPSKYNSDYKQNLKSFSGIIDFNALSKDYDGFFLKNKFLYNPDYEKWCVASLCLFNLNAIEYYEPISIDASPTQYSPGLVDYYFSIEKKFDPAYIQSEKEYFTKLINDLKLGFKYFLFNTNVKIDYDNFFSYYKSMYDACEYFISLNKDRINFIFDKLVNDKVFEKTHTNYLNIIRSISQRLLYDNLSYEENRLVKGL